MVYFIIEWLIFTRNRIVTENIKGREWREYGYNEVEWDGTDAKGNELANGMYLFKITADHEGKVVTKTGKALIIR